MKILYRILLWTLSLIVGLDTIVFSEVSWIWTHAAHSTNLVEGFFFWTGVFFVCVTSVIGLFALFFLSVLLIVDIVISLKKKRKIKWYKPCGLLLVILLIIVGSLWPR